MQSVSAKMRDADMDPVMHRHPSRPGPQSPPPASAPNNKFGSKVHSRDVAMKHDQSNKGYDNNDHDRVRDRRDRDRFDSDRRVSAINSHSRPPASRSQSPASRRREGYSVRTGNTRDEPFSRQNDRSYKSDVNQRGRSQDRSRNLEDDGSREVKDRPLRDHSRHRNIPTSPRHGPRSNDYASHGARGRSFRQRPEKDGGAGARSLSHLRGPRNLGASVNVTADVALNGRRG